MLTRGLRLNSLRAAEQVQCVAWQAENPNHQDDSSHYGTTEEDFSFNHELYASHIPTSLTQKVILGIGSSVVGLLDPRRAGESGKMD